MKTNDAFHAARLVRALSVSFCALLTVLAATALAEPAGAAEVTADWKLVYQDTASGADTGSQWLSRVLAEQLVDDFREATGWTLKVLPQSKAPAGTKGLWLGAPAAKAAGFSCAGWQFYENAYAVTNGSVYCFGNDHQGRTKDWDERRMVLPSARAAIRFMRDVVGARYVMPDVNGRAVPKCAPLTLPEGKYSYEKPFLVYGSASGIRWHLPYLYGGSHFPMGSFHSYGGHSYPSAVPNELFRDHPEYFAVGEDGKRRTVGGCTPLCISNPEVQERIYAELKKRFDAGAEVCQLGQNDGDSRCRCEKCRALYGTDDWGEKHWIFHRKLAERALRECPGKVVHIMSYAQTGHPPKSFSEFPPNVMIELCNYSEESFREWSKVKVPHGFTVYIYLWGDYPLPGLTPKRSFAGIATLIDRFRRNNVVGIFRCGGMELPGLEGPQYYWFDRLLEDPKADIGATLQEFCDAAFGPAAGEPMRRFYDTLDSRLRAFDCMSTGHYEATLKTARYASALPRNPLDLLAYVYTPETVESMDGALATAKRLVTGTRERIRLKRVELEWRYARNMGRIATLYAGYRAAPNFGAFEPLAKEIRWRNAFLERYGEKGPTLGDWPHTPLFRAEPRANVRTNGRLGAYIGSPLDWDVDYYLKERIAPGAPGEVARWKAYNAEKGLKPLTNWKPDGGLKAGQTFELRPEKTGFAFDPGTTGDIRIRTLEKLKPHRRYRVSWFYRLEDVRRTGRGGICGFYAAVPFAPGGDNQRFLPTGSSATGTSGWRHESVVVTATSDRDFYSEIRFRLLGARGRAEVEDVTVEDLGPSESAAPAAAPAAAPEPGAVPVFGEAQYDPARKPIENLLAIQRAVDACADECILVEPLPRGFAKDSPARAAWELAGRQAYKLCDTNRIHLLRMGAPFLKGDGSLNAALYEADGLRLNAAGCAECAKRVKALADWLSGPRTARSPETKVGYLSDITGTRIQFRRGARENHARWWWNRTVEKLAEADAIRAKGGDLDLLLIGDSLTHRWEYGDSGAPVLKNLTARYRVLNTAIGGDRWEQQHWIVQSGLIDGLKPRYVSILLGANNHDYTWKNDSPEKTRDGVKKVIDAVRAKCPRAQFILYPMMMRLEERPRTKEIRAKDLETIPLLRELAKREGAHWVEFDREMRSAVGGPDALRLKYTTDFTHLSTYMFERWYEALLPLLSAPR